MWELTQDPLRGCLQIKHLIIRHPESNHTLFFITFWFLLPGQEQRWCFSPQISWGQRDAAKQDQSFTKTRVAILPLPVPHTRPPLNSLPTHSFPLPLFVSWEDTSLEKPLRRLFKGLCVAGWQRTPLSAFSLIWKTWARLKRGSSAPSLKTLLSTLQRHPAVPCLSLGGLPPLVLRPPYSVWYQRYCERGTKNRKHGGRRGRLEGQRNQSLYDGCGAGARSPEMHQTRRCKARPPRLFFPSLTQLQPAIKATLSGDFTVSVWRDINRNSRAPILLIYCRLLWLFRPLTI